jgi:hypothetical protein
MWEPPTSETDNSHRVAGAADIYTSQPATWLSGHPHKRYPVSAHNCSSNRLASVSHSYAYVTEHGSSLIKRTALQRVYTASSCKSLAGQLIHSSDFITSNAVTGSDSASAHRSASHDTSSAGQPSHNHWAVAKKTVARNKHLLL